MPFKLEIKYFKNLNYIISLCLKGRARTQYEHIPMEELESKEVAEILGTLPRAKRAEGARAQQNTGKLALKESYGGCTVKSGTVVP